MRRARTLGSSRTRSRQNGDDDVNFIKFLSTFLCSTNCCVFVFKLNRNSRPSYEHSPIDHRHSCASAHALECCCNQLVSGADMYSLNDSLSAVFESSPLRWRGISSMYCTSSGIHPWRSCRLGKLSTHRAMDPFPSALTTTSGSPCPTCHESGQSPPPQRPLGDR